MQKNVCHVRVKDGFLACADKAEITGLNGANAKRVVPLVE